MNMEDLVRPEVLAMAGYHPGPSLEELCRQYGLAEIIQLASNENAWGTSPQALEAIREESARAERYPDSTSLKLRLALAENLGVDPEMIVVGNGADNILLIIALTFLRPGDEVVAADLTFPIYRKVAALTGARPVEVPLKNLTHDLEAMGRALSPRTRLVFLCNPNNPTGTVVEPEALMKFAAGLPPGVVGVLDEVYIQFAAEHLRPDSLSLIKSGRPLISINSFSKLYGLAGLRIGYAVAPPEITVQLAKVKEAFAVNSLAQAAALAALGDDQFRNLTLSRNAEQREILTWELSALGLDCAPSQTNFLFVDFRREAGPVCEGLLQRGVLIRSMAVWGAPTCARLTIGTGEQNQKLLEAFKEVLA